MTKKKKTSEESLFVNMTTACEILGISKSTFARTRNIPGFPKPFLLGQGGGCPRFKKSELLEWAERRRSA